MDILPLHIEYLLTRHDCVIVPGFGAFIATEEESYIDFEGGVIRPRRREIGFNGSVVTDDGLLSHSIARREGISYEDARRMLARMTEKLTADLEEEGEVSLGMVGRILKNSEGLISYQPRQSRIHADVMADLKLNGKDDSVDHLSKAGAETAEEETLENDGMRTIRVRADRYVFTVSKRAVHAAAMVIAILTVGLSLLVPINHDNEQKASVISIEGFFHHSLRPQAFNSSDNSAVSVEEADTTASAEVHLDR